jgi:hypothetical protein
MLLGQGSFQHFILLPFFHRRVNLSFTCLYAKNVPSAFEVDRSNFEEWSFLKQLNATVSHDWMHAVKAWDKYTWNNNYDTVQACVTVRCKQIPLCLLSKCSVDGWIFHTKRSKTILLEPTELKRTEMKKGEGEQGGRKERNKKKERTQKIKADKDWRRKRETDKERNERS